MTHTHFMYTVKKGYQFSRPQPGCHLPNSSWPGIIKLFPARKSLVSDFPAGDRKTVKFFFTVYSLEGSFYPAFLEHSTGKKSPPSTPSPPPRGEILAWRLPMSRGGEGGFHNSPPPQCIFPPPSTSGVLLVWRNGGVACSWQSL